MTNSLLVLVDNLDFRGLFVEALGWGNPDQQPQHVMVDDRQYTLTQVAGYKGLRIWQCPALPPRPIQRRIDQIVGATSTERLIIFTGPDRQDWRWPRRRQTGATNAKLLVHEHLVGQPNPGLLRRLQAIELDLDMDLSLVALLERMREAFDAESESASVQAARLMRTLYTDLDAAGVNEHDATLILARLLFLFFGDDTDMWHPQPANQFHHYIRDHTTSATLHKSLGSLFRTLNTPERERDAHRVGQLGNFRYINGGLFGQVVDVPLLTEAFRQRLLEACDFDWSIISPAIFGSMFQTVKSKEARRGGGEHYTTAENIHKTIDPLFLDELHDRLDSAWDDKSQLTRLHNELGRLRFLDPACGCGNFLIVTYRELRNLELEILKRRRDLDVIDGITGTIDRSQLSLDVTSDLKVTLDHFFGIEIEEWPARIAETAMLLVDHLANQAMAEEFGQAPDRLPIAIAPTIVHRNALRVDWKVLLPPSPDVIIIGNPPFVGGRTKSAAQKADSISVWGSQYIGDLDYVTCWYLKAMSYYGSHNGRWAFVSTSSICQGIPVPNLWRPILNAGWRCRFAHRAFQWETEAADGAAVHVSIVGFDRGRTSPKPILWTYPEGGKGAPTSGQVTNINPYLVAYSDVLVDPVMRALNPALTQVNYANKPSDGGFLTVTADDYAEVAGDPITRKYLRRFVGARELLHNLDRWCLWIEAPPAPEDIYDSPVLKSRLAGVRKMREESSAAETRAKASIPYKFGQIQQPKTHYLAIPKTVSAFRRYLPVAYFESEVIASDKVYTVPDPDGFLLGVLSSTFFITWMKTIGGRLKSDLSFSNKLAYNTFPLPGMDEKKRSAVATAAEGILSARAAHQNTSLATLYNATSMGADLMLAHGKVDEIIDGYFGVDVGVDEEERRRVLFRLYEARTGRWQKS